MDGNWCPAWRQPTANLQNNACDTGVFCNLFEVPLSSSNRWSTCSYCTLRRAFASRPAFLAESARRAGGVSSPVIAIVTILCAVSRRDHYHGDCPSYAGSMTQADEKIAFSRHLDFSSSRRIPRMATAKASMAQQSWRNLRRGTEHCPPPWRQSVHQALCIDISNIPASRSRTARP
jgi:hypothetical protein